jgi:hypothetical protein
MKQTMRQPSSRLSLASAFTALMAIGGIAPAAAQQSAREAASHRRSGSIPSIAGLPSSRMRMSFPIPRGRTGGSSEQLPPERFNSRRRSRGQPSQLAPLGAAGCGNRPGLALTRRSAELAQKLYDPGRSGYRELLDTLRNLASVERNAVQLRGNRAAATLSLIRALGGWDAQQAAGLANAGLAAQ